MQEGKVDGERRKNIIKCTCNIKLIVDSLHTVSRR